ncbi:MAG: MFS transporter [Bacteroidota bacterium]
MENNAPTPPVLNDKRVIHGWAMFDWANSSYALVIAVAIFPIYFNQYIDDEFLFWGIEMTDTALFSYALAAAYLIISIALPLLTGIADYGGRKLFFMRIFTTIGGLACIGLYFFHDHDDLWIALLGFILAVIGFAGGQVFYNSFLPEIASEDQYDKVSARGFAYGYIGSVLLLIVNVAMLQKPEWFGLGDGQMAAKVSFVMVGLWWMGFAQVSFRLLPKDRRVKGVENLIAKGYQEIRRVAGFVRQQPMMMRFLASFFFYSAGVQTLLYLASTFAADELQFGTTELIGVILLLQFVAILGAYVFSRLSDWRGNKFSLVTMLVIWISICVVAYLVQGKTEFYFVAATVGLVMGGIQSLSRSTYTKLLPTQTKDTASYFSFFDVLEKVAIVLGTFSFGLIEQVTGGMRNSILALIVFFVLGLVILLTVRIQPAQPVPTSA